MTAFGTVSAVDAEDAVRTWLRNAAVGPAGARVFFGLPPEYDLAAKGPAVALQVIDSDSGDNTTAGLEHVLWQFDCWAATRVLALQTRVALLNLLYGLEQVTVPGKALLVAAYGIRWRFLPDPTDPPTPRYVVEATITTG